jgi:hypothetical protein
MQHRGSSLKNASRPPHRPKHRFSFRWMRFAERPNVDIWMIPAFTKEGVLPPGRYLATPAEVEQRLVMPFPTSMKKARSQRAARRRSRLASGPRRPWGGARTRTETDEGAE